MFVVKDKGGKQIHRICTFWKSINIRSKMDKLSLVV